MTHIYIIIIFFLFTVPENHSTLILFIYYFFSRFIHLSNQNLLVSINISNYAHKFLIFLT